MNYSEFKDYLAVFLWKVNDQALVANLDTLITMANSELNRSLPLMRRQRTLNITPTEQDEVLPADYRNIISLTNIDPAFHRVYSQTQLSDIYQKRVTANGQHMPLYGIDESFGVKYLRLIGPFSVTNPGNLVLVYGANVPDFATLDSSWLADDYLDLYTYAVLSHCAPFLREDERVPLWQGMKAEAIATALEEDEHRNKHGGSPLYMKPHRKVP